MHKKSIVLGLSILVNVALGAQEPPPQIAKEAAACILENRLTDVPLSTKAIKVGYVLDTRTSPGLKYVFVAIFKAKGSGDLFEFWFGSDEGSRVLRIMNDASFVDTGKEIDFPEPPFGGVWTNEHMRAKLRKIERGRKYRISLESIRHIPHDLECLYYGEPTKKDKQ